MPNETLMDKAVRNYNVAVMVKNQMGDDEAYLNFVGYHLQQAVELCLKYQLEKNGTDYPRTHDIDQLIRIGDQNGADLILTDYISDHCEMFSLWEARTRYVLDYRLEDQKAEKALAEVGAFLTLVLKHEKECEEGNQSGPEHGEGHSAGQEVKKPS